MKTDRIWVGDIMQCVGYEEDTVVSSKAEEVKMVYKKFQVVKENAVLIAMKNGFYIDIEDINWRDILLGPAEEVVAIPKETEAHNKGDLFVDRNSLQPYAAVYGELETENIGLGKLKQLVRG